MNPPRVTIIIATYNYGRYLRTAIASLRAQTMRDWECIVVDDASTDDTPAILEEAASVDTRIRYMRNVRNMGVSAARNLALAAAQGEHIQFLDADDAIAPGKLERQAAFLDAKPHVAVVWSDFAHFTSTPDFSASGELRPDERLEGAGARILNRLLKGNVVRINTALTRASVIRELRGFRAEFRAVEDLHLWLRIAAGAHRYAFLDDPACLSAVRVNPHGLSKDAKGMRRFMPPVLQDLWCHHALGAMTSANLLLRHADFALDMMLIRREPVVVLPDRRGAFLARAVPLALLLLPFWLIVRPFRR
jgi:glycosyltransferase involved in cell wall biosynthesis